MATHVTPEDDDTIKVKIGTIGGVIQEIMLNGDRTVGAVLEAAGFPAGSEVRVNSEKFDEADTVEDGDSLIVVAREEDKPKGAC